MKKFKKTNSFVADLQIVGINPYVLIPDNILKDIFIQAGKNKGHIPVYGFINDLSYTQTLLKYKGEWRLYVNMKMLPGSPKRIGEKISVSIELDNKDRTIAMHPKFAEALENDLEAKKQFGNLTPSLQKEIIRYISFLKREETLTKNVSAAIGFLKGKNRFLARNPINKQTI